MRIGMLTGGGDCPGLNAVIRAVVRKGAGEYGHTILGYRHGWRGRRRCFLQRRLEWCSWAIGGRLAQIAGAMGPSY